MKDKNFQSVFDVLLFLSFALDVSQNSFCLIVQGPEYFILCSGEWDFLTQLSFCPSLET